MGTSRVAATSPTGEVMLEAGVGRAGGAGNVSNGTTTKVRIILVPRDMVRVLKQGPTSSPMADLVVVTHIHREAMEVSRVSVRRPTKPRLVTTVQHQHRHRGRQASAFRGEL